MDSLKLNERIAALRRARGMTQETLAGLLGVSNQAVSKWESNQCCPDIALLPELARIFSVSIDDLFGYAVPMEQGNLTSMLRHRIEEMPEGEDYTEVLRLAYLLHGTILAKSIAMTERERHSWGSDASLERAMRGEWGYSCLNLPALTTVMRQDTVLFSGNRKPFHSSEQRRVVARMLRTFGEIENFDLFCALYELTSCDEETYASAEEIADICGMAASAVIDRLRGVLDTYVVDKRGESETRWRIRGMYMDLIPLLALLENRG